LKIRIKLMLIFTAILTVSLVTLSYLNYSKAKHLLTDNVEQNITSLAKTHGNELGLMLDARKNEIVLLANSPLIVDGSKETILSYLSAEAERSQTYDYFLVTDAKGDYYTTLQGTGNLTDRDYYQEAMATGNPVVSNPVVSKTTGKCVIIIGSPIKKNGQITGFLGGAMLVDAFSQKVASIKVGETGYAYLVQGDGLVIAHPNADLVMQYNPLEDQNIDPILAEAVKKMTQKESGFACHTAAGTDCYTAYAPVPGSDWSIAITLSASEVLAQLSSLTKVSFGTALGVFLIAAIVVIVFAQRLVQPISILQRELSLLAEKGGDLTQEISVPSKDEIGDLAYAVNRFLANIRNIVINVHNNANTIAEASQQLNTSARQTSETASATAATAAEIADAIGNVSHNTREVAASSKETLQEAASGAQDVERIARQMHMISSTSEKILSMVQSLGGTINQVNHIVELITNIADQTNMLALNASIEAARAGEQGRGFAVVAEEVRILAEQSASAAKEINQLIDNVHQESQQTIDAIAASDEQVKAGALVVDEVGKRFGKIMDSIERLAQQFNEVAEGAEQVAAGAQNIAGTTEEQTATMEEVSGAVEKLTQMAFDLNQLVSKFNV